MPDAIPEDIQQFILLHIDSIAQWEALLLMRGNPQIEWTSDTMAQRLYISGPEALALLRYLAGQGFLIQAHTHYRYQPKSHDTEHLIDRAAMLYARSLVPITHLIHSKPKTKVQKFADAFRIRKD